MISVLDHGHVALRNLAGPTRRLTKLQGSHQRIDREFVGAKSASGAKQGQDATLPLETQAVFRSKLHARCRSSYSDYLWAIRVGVAPEHARLNLHLNHYTHWLWKQDLYNVMHFLRLRDHFHAQIEAQRYAQSVDTLLRQQLPECMGLYDKYRRQKMKEVKAYLLQNLADATDLPELSFTDDLTPADRDAGWTSTPLFIEVEMPRGR